jgi:hypothetical protein
MVNMIGRKCELNKKYRSDSIWDKLGVLYQNIRNVEVIEFGINYVSSIRIF